MNEKLKEKTLESLSAVLPVTGIVLAVSIFLVPMELGSMVMFLTGALMLVVGMGLFQLGAESAMTPIGEGVGVQLSKTKHVGGVLLLSFLMGVIITVSEPDLQVLAQQVPSIPNEILILTVAVGVGIFLALAVVNRGFSTDVMEAAKKAGASGGTVVNGRRIGNEEVQSFWGITVQDEKDLVLILTEADNKVNLMREISQSCGMHSDAKGIVTAIPVDSLAGLGYAQRENE